jgi:hypothetical protein
MVYCKTISKLTRQRYIFNKGHIIKLQIAKNSSIVYYESITYLEL